jgi:hypothetical protein
LRPHQSIVRATVIAIGSAALVATTVLAAVSTRSRAESGRHATPVASATAVSDATSPDPDSLALDALAAMLPREPHQFYFTRGIYTDANSGRFGGRGGGRGSWSTDWPKSDHQFLAVLRRLTIIDAYNSDNPVALDDPALRRFPFLYILEVGRIALNPEEEKGLREYMLAGGFVFVDDFWGMDEWIPFAEQMKRVLPEYEIVDLPMTHPIFSAFYHIKQMQTLPSINHVSNGSDTECFGCYIQVKGIFDEGGRLMMLISWNSDHGDAWEWAEQPAYPLKLSTYAFEVGVNAIVYSMSH